MALRAVPAVWNKSGEVLEVDLNGEGKCIILATVDHDNIGRFELYVESEDLTDEEMALIANTPFLALGFNGTLDDLVDSIMRSDGYIMEGWADAFERAASRLREKVNCS